jgi:hypothetical protein
VADALDDAVGPGWDNAGCHHIDPVWQADIGHPFDLGTIDPMGN